MEEVNGTLLILLGSMAIISRLAARFFATRGQRGDAVRDTFILQLANGWGLGSIIGFSLGYLLPEIISAAPSSWPYYFLRFFLFYRSEKIMYGWLEYLAQHFELKDRVSHQSDMEWTLWIIIRGFVMMLCLSFAMAQSIPPSQAWRMFGALISHKLAVALIARTSFSAKKGGLWFFILCSLTYSFLSSLAIFLTCPPLWSKTFNDILIVVCQCIIIVKLTSWRFELRYGKKNEWPMFRRYIFELLLDDDTTSKFVWPKDEQGQEKTHEEQTQTDLHEVNKRGSELVSHHED